MKLKNIIYFGFLLCFALPSHAHINPEQQNTAPVNTNTEINFREDCQAAASQEDLSINNVRARLLTGGDVWWDLQDGKYIVPNPPIGSGIPEVSSIFAGGVWIGGLDPAGNLKLAATTYRTGGRVDFFSGPIDPETGLTDLPICQDWDRFFLLDGESERQFISNYDGKVESGEAFDCDEIPDDVKYWPATGNPYWLENFDFALPNTGQGLGSFWDDDLDGLYDPCKGDFPIIDIRGCEPLTRDAAKELIPDQMIFWIYNDAGSVHSLTQGSPIQMEVQVQAFAYATNDEINDMTFYRYKLINRAVTDIRDCYFAMWVDPDLGCYTDDYVGCDVSRSLAYTYNEDALDGQTGCNCPDGVNSYCDEVPIIGTDYFRGPLAPVKIVEEGGSQHIIVRGDQIFIPGYEIGDSIRIVQQALGDNDSPDANIGLGMSSFIYYNNGAIGNNPPGTTDPNIASEYYNYLRGIWRDDTPVTFGGSGYNPASQDTVRYTFPDDPDINGGWSMCEESLGNGDRRTLQASGPFLLKPGAKNELIVGAVWVPDLVYPCPDISRLQNADDIAQALFDNCFDLLDGPDAPDVCPIALDKEIIMVLSNDTVTSNNAFEAYFEKDIYSPDGFEPAEAVNYVFEGYKIYQLRNPNVTAQELNDIENSRLVIQTDIKNGVVEQYNWTSVFDPNPNNEEVIWIPQIEVMGANDGINHSFQIERDVFAEGDQRLVNHKEYYYTAIAYAHNQYEVFDPQMGLGQRTTYLEGRKNIKTYTVVPRPIIYKNILAEYGDGAKVTRLSGVGVGGNFVDMEEEMYDQILSGSFDGTIDYKAGAGPIDIKIYNPLEVKDGNYELEILGDHVSGSICSMEPGATWKVTNLDNGEVILSEDNIDNLNEQLLTDYGFSVSVVQTNEPGDAIDEDNGAITVLSEYANDGTPWYRALGDDANMITEDEGFFGVQTYLNFLRTNINEPDFALDPNQSYSNFGDGSFYPFFLSSGERTNVAEGIDPFITPAWKGSQGFVRNGNSMKNLNNVDIVMTQDPSKWSRCVVVETASEDYTAADQTIGNARQFDLRRSESVGTNGLPDGDGMGMGYFPGYAIDVETGERLNIFFGENSIYDEDVSMFLDGEAPIGGDMIFNPSSQLFSFDFNQGGQNLDPRFLVAGGNHFIYVTRQKYDGCELIRDRLSGGLSSKINALKSITWTSMALLPSGVNMLSVADGLVPNDVTIKVRVDNQYNLASEFDISAPNGCNETGELPKYQFEIRGQEATDLEQEDYAGALENVRIVPNPYYGSSDYETGALTNTIKITNLPDNAVVTIYSLDGKFIRQFNRDLSPTVKTTNNPGTQTVQTSPNVSWDMKNFNGIPIASGVYIFHVSAPGLGEERSLKWFGVKRKLDASRL